MALGSKVTVAGGGVLRGVTIPSGNAGDFCVYASRVNSENRNDVGNSNVSIQLDQFTR